MLPHLSNTTGGDCNTNASPKLAPETHPRLTDPTNYPTSELGNRIPFRRQHFGRVRFLKWVILGNRSRTFPASETASYSIAKDPKTSLVFKSTARLHPTPQRCAPRSHPAQRRASEPH